MKLVYLALVGAIAAHRLNHVDSEWTTKADNGENDDTVLHASSLDENRGVKWVNPLTVKDDGTGDETVVLQSRAQNMAVQKRHKKREIYDADGDGVEDNYQHSREQLDRFYHPAVYGVVEDIYNTHHGNLPGHRRKAEEQGPPAENDPWVIGRPYMAQVNSGDDQLPKNDPAKQDESQGLAQADDENIDEEDDDDMEEQELGAEEGEDII